MDQSYPIYAQSPALFHGFKLDFVVAVTKVIKTILEISLDMQKVSNTWNNVIYNLGKINTILNNTDSKRFSRSQFASLSSGFRHSLS